MRVSPFTNPFYEVALVIVVVLIGITAFSGGYPDPSAPVSKEESLKTALEIVEDNKTNWRGNKYTQESYDSMTDRLLDELSKLEEEVEP